MQRCLTLVGCLYERLAELPKLVEDRYVSIRKHPSLPLRIYNYTIRAQLLPIVEWPPALCDCRGLILDEDGEIAGRPFRKFWNYEQVREMMPAAERFNVWEKLDGSLGIVCCYQGRRVVATRGSFDSDQALWAQAWFDANHPDFFPEHTHLFEIIYPKNRIVVDYGERMGCVLLAVLDAHGRDLWERFDGVDSFPKARRFDGIRDFKSIEADPQFDGGEGFVVQWESGFRAKIKLAEYTRLHRLITQCSTRTIWEMLRSGSDTRGPFERVPPEFYQWVQEQIASLQGRFAAVDADARSAYAAAPACDSRKEFADYAKKYAHPSLLFSLLDGKPIDDALWKIIEPKWAVPFRSDPE